MGSRSFKHVILASKVLLTSLQSTFEHQSPLFRTSSLRGHRKPFDPTQPVGFHRKVWKANKKAKRLVLGNDVGLEDTCRMELCALVGWISYISLSNVSLEVWIRNQWLPLLGYSPEVIYLTKGWLGFICNSPKGASLLLSSLWVFGGSSLMLKRWRIAFNPDTDYFQFRHLWVLLSGLPLYLWNEGAL